MAWSLFRKREKKEKPPSCAPKKVTTEAPKATGGKGPLSICNLQLLGEREEQQDAFYISALEQYGEKGLLAILCDGMGGMSEGGSIANDVLARMREEFIPEQTERTATLLSALNREVYGAYRGQGGTTLVLLYLKGGAARFWSVGDSDLYLMREGRLYAVNLRHEYENELLIQALAVGAPVDGAFTDAQRGALYRYIGSQDFSCDSFSTPFPLKDGDVWLLCSDGVSDTLTQQQLQEALLREPKDAAAQMEAQIQAAEFPGQDNATAVIIAYHHENSMEEQIHE